MSLHANEPSCSRTTAAVRAGIDRDTAHGAVTPPIVLSSNFSFEGFGNKRQYDYTRSGNPTRDLLGEALAELEGGAGGVITATGMGAINLVLNALLQPGDTLVVPHDAYGGSWRLFNALAKKGHFELVTADLTDPRALAQALATQPKLVLVETRPTRCCASPTCASSSMPRTRPVRWWWSTTPSCRRRCSSRCRSVRTWCCIRPPSTSTATAMWSVARWSRDPALHEQLVWWGNALGLTGSPFDAFLTLRGLRTLDARLRVHQENTASIVALLDQHPAVGTVYYPGLADHPGHAIAARQQTASARCCRSNWRTARR
jgi:cystathionine gamma-synthase